MTRIVAGRFGGRTLATPRGTVTRPTSERVRAAIGNALEAGGGLAGAQVLDLYAGSGALGLELLSRGAAGVVLVEQDRAAVAAARVNLERLGLSNGDGTTVVAAAVQGYIDAGAQPRPSAGFDVVVADPPYGTAAAEVVAALTGLHRAGALAPGADVVLERASRSGEFGWPEQFESVRSRRYGDTLLCYGRAP